MAKYVSGRQKDLRVGISSYSETKKSLEVIGRVGVGTTSFDADAALDIRGDVILSGVTTLASSGGITTTGGDFYVGGDLYVLDDVVYDEVTGRNINITGVGTVGTVSVASSIWVGGDDGTKLSFYTDTPSTSSVVENRTGNLYLQDVDGNIYIRAKRDQDSIYCESDGSVDLYYSGAKKLETTNEGVLVSGSTTTSGLSVTGVSTLGSSSGLGAVKVGYGNTAFIVEGNGRVTGILTVNTLEVLTGGAWGPDGDLTVTTLVGTALSISGISTFSSRVHLPDGAILNFGAGAGGMDGDLQIKSDGSLSHIEEREDGLRIYSDDLQLNSYSNAESYLSATENGSVELYYNNVKKLETSGIGITVTGVTSTTNLYSTGISTFKGNIDANAGLDVDGQTDLDVLNVAETATFSALIDANARLDVVGGANIDQVNVTGVSTLGSNVIVGGATTDLLVNGDCRITGILTVGTDSITIDGNTDIMNVGSGITMYASAGIISAQTLYVNTRNIVNEIDTIIAGTGVIVQEEGTDIKGGTGRFERVNFVGDNLTATDFLGAGNTANITFTDTPVFDSLKINASGISTFAGLTTVTSADAFHAKQLSISGVSTLGVVTDVTSIEATNFYGTLTGTASNATQWATPRSIQLTGDVVATETYFDGTGNVSIAATIQANSVNLGGDTVGDYVQDISAGVSDDGISISPTSGEGASVTVQFGNKVVIPNEFGVIGLATFGSNVTIAGNASFDGNANINNNLHVAGNITVGGTSAYIVVDEFRVTDKDIVVGYTTDSNNDNVSNDITANGGGIAVASTIGNPLVDLTIAGVHTHPSTYKDFAWFKIGAFSGLNTDAWLSNYPIGIGSTQFPTGTRLVAGNVQVSEDDIRQVRHINASGIITASIIGDSSTTVFYGDGSNLDGLVVSPVFDNVTGGASTTRSIGIGTTAVDSNVSLNVVGTTTTTQLIVSDTIINGADPHVDVNNVGQRMDPTTGIVARSAGTNHLWRGYQTGGNVTTSEIKADGVGIFSGAVQSGNDPNPSSGTPSPGTKIADWGTVFACNAGTSSVFAGYTTGDTDPKVLLYADGEAKFKKYATFGDSTTMPGGTGGIKIYRNRTDPGDIARINIGESDANAVWENNGNFVLKYDGSANFAGTNIGIDSTGQLTIKKGAPYTDPSFRILDRENSNANGVLMYGDGSSVFKGAMSIADLDAGSANDPLLTLRNPNDNGDVVVITSAGIATFAGKVQVGDAPYWGEGIGAYMNGANGNIVACNSNGSDNLWSGFNSPGAQTSKIAASGSAYFAGIVTAGAAQFTSNLTPTTGEGVEIFCPSSGVGQISSYDRTNSDWDALRIKASQLEVFTEGGEKMRITPTGNVGLNVDPGNFGNDVYRGIQVHSGSNAYLTLTNSATGNTASTDGFSLSLSGSDINLIQRENADMIFHTNNTEKVRISAGGTFTHTPAGDTSTNAYLKSDSTSNTYVQKIQKDGAVDTNLNFSLQDGGILKTVLYLDGERESVGIGTTNPLDLLHVYDSNSGATPYSQAQVVLESYGSTNWINFLNRNTQNAGLTWSDTDDTDVAQVYYDHNVNKMYLKSNDVGQNLVLDSGHVGVGTDNPTGTAALTNNTAVLAVGVVTANTLYGDGSGITNLPAPATAGDKFNTGISSVIQLAPGSVDSILHTFPSDVSKKYIIESISVANVVSTGTTVNIIASVGSTSPGSNVGAGTSINEKTYIAYNVPIPTGGLIELLKEPMVINANDTLSMWSTDMSYIGVPAATEVYISYSEKSDTEYFGTYASNTSIGGTSIITIQESTSYPSVVQSIHLANRSNVGDYPISVSITNGTDTTYLAKNLIIPRYSAVEILERPKRIQTGGKIKVQVQQTSTVDVSISGKQITS